MNEIQKGAQAPLSRETACRTREISFGQWVEVYLSAKFVQPTLGAKIKVRGVPHDGGVKIFMYGCIRSREFPGDPEVAYEAAKLQLDDLISEVAEQCDEWTREGYAISLKNFEISISVI